MKSQGISRNFLIKEHFIEMSRNFKELSFEESKNFKELRVEKSRTLRDFSLLITNKKANKPLKDTLLNCKIDSLIIPYYLDLMTIYYTNFWYNKF